MEDLWSFNEESVARAVFASKIPVISAVGHESDVVITDFAADVRAATPTAAAELAVGSYYELQERIAAYRYNLDKEWNVKLTECKHRLEILERRLYSASPESGIKDSKKRIEQLRMRLDLVMDKRLTDRRNQLGLLAERLKGLSPLDKLSQGYSYVSDDAGQTVNDASKVKNGDNLNIYVKNGRIKATVTEVSIDG